MSTAAAIAKDDRGDEEQHEAEHERQRSEDETADELRREPIHRSARRVFRC